MLVMPALEKLIQEDWLKLKLGLACRARLYLKKNIDQTSAVPVSTSDTPGQAY